ncbi:MAG TPA: phosphotransferase family protein [Thermoleophilaceae bacterium]|nr:phosphotransferase family protein [Thermoleophilaceae bacterium]
MDVVRTRQEAEQQERPPLIVLEPLEEYFDSRGLGSGPIEAEAIGEGHSNVTYLITRGDDRFVLRRPPRPPLPPSAHDMLREARLLEAIDGADVRTPPVLDACDDESVLGVPFYVMEFLHGTVITSQVPERLSTPEERRRICLELVDALAEMHAVDWRACGLEGFGKPTGYLDRQLRRFNGLWEVNKTRDLPLVQEVGEWLAANKPEQSDATIVHGDYRLGNTMFASEAPARLIAIFDWEMATIGDPLADVGYLTATWSQPDGGDREPTMFDMLTVTHEPGFLGRDELVARYEEVSGRSMTDLRWYQALALWKAAVFMEGNYKRSLAGATDDPYLRFFDVGVPQLAEAAFGITRMPAPST